jgi:hypothetical protein
MPELPEHGTVDRDTRLKAAQGTLPVTVAENVSMLVGLLTDEDADVRSTATRTLARIPEATIATLLTDIDISHEVRIHFGDRAELASPPIASAGDRSAHTCGSELQTGAVAPSIATTDPGVDSLLTAEEGVDRESIFGKLTQMGVPERVKAAVTGSREVRALLIRDPNRMIAAAVLSSPKLTESEVESFARMGNVSEDVLRIIGSNRGWMKNYGVVVALVKNAKTPLAISLNLMPRLMERDLVKLSVDRNVTDPLRVAAKRRVGNAKS